jgi:hypothetical protein
MLDDLQTAATGLGTHPQDHGWRELYRLFAHTLNQPESSLATMILDQHRARSAFSATHLLTLLGIAFKVAAPDYFAAVAYEGPLDSRLETLKRGLEQHHVQIAEMMRTRQNSFTAVRRFLIPQIVLSAYFSGSGDHREANFADFGTGLGVLPRQLNSAEQYRTFSADLVWPDGAPSFRTIPLRSRFGVDRGPLPDVDWVRACYGESDYYSSLYDELLRSMTAPEVADSDVQYAEIDLLDLESLIEFIHRHQINAANLTYVLYEFERAKRTMIVDALIRELYEPGALIIVEPKNGLERQGAIVEFFHHGDSRPQTLCYVSDGHCKGYIIPLDDYEGFSRDYPLYA